MQRPFFVCGRRMLRDQSLLRLPLYINYLPGSTSLQERRNGKGCTNPGDITAPESFIASPGAAAATLGFMEHEAASDRDTMKPTEQCCARYVQPFSYVIAR